MGDKYTRRPHEGDLHVTLEGKTAELIRNECKERQMGTDHLVRDIIWCWFTDLQKARREPSRPTKPSRPTVLKP